MFFVWSYDVYRHSRPQGQNSSYDAGTDTHHQRVDQLHTGRSGTRWHWPTLSAQRQPSCTNDITRPDRKCILVYPCHEKCILWHELKHLVPCLHSVCHWHYDHCSDMAVWGTQQQSQNRKTDKTLTLPIAAM